MSVLRQTFDIRPQPPASQDPVYGVLWQPYAADTGRSPLRLQQQKVRSYHIHGASCNDPSLWPAHL